MLCKSLKRVPYSYQLDAASSMLNVLYDRRERLVNGGILESPFGSGKSFIILIYLANRLAIPTKPLFFSETKRVMLGEPVKLKLDPIVSVDYALRNIINCAFLIVASSVFFQWISEIESSTTLRVFKVMNGLDVLKLIAIMEKGLHAFDIVLVKNGSTVVDLPLDRRKIRRGVQIPIYEAIAAITQEKGKCWRECIIDDYSIGGQLPHDNGITICLPAQFTWYVSATHSSRAADIRKKVTHLRGIYRYNVAHAILDLADSEFHVKVSPSDIGSSTRMSFPEYHIVRCSNSNDKIIQAIGYMSSDKANRILEALNGDSVSDAAAIAGIHTLSISEIFNKLLADNKEEYRTLKDLVAWLEGLSTDGLPEAPEGMTYTKTDMTRKAPLEFFFPDFEKKKSEVLDASLRKIASLESALQRVHEDFKEGTCPICYDDLANSNLIIMPCCGRIICANCVKCGGKIKTTRVENSSNIRCTCPMCRAGLDFSSLIFLDERADVAGILSGQEAVLELKEDIEPMAKIDAVINIIRRIPIITERVKHSIENLMGDDSVVLPEPPPSLYKVAIFSMFDGSLYKVSAELEKQNIEHQYLHGTARNLAICSKEFNDESCNSVLLINGNRVATGINLQGMTDLIFWHAIGYRCGFGASIISQIIGRANRIGRKYKLRVYHLLYRSESV